MTAPFEELPLIEGHRCANCKGPVRLSPGGPVCMYGHGGNEEPGTPLDSDEVSLRIGQRWVKQGLNVTFALSADKRQMTVHIVDPSKIPANPQPAATMRLFLVYRWNTLSIVRTTSHQRAEELADRFSAELECEPTCELPVDGPEAVLFEREYTPPDSR